MWKNLSLIKAISLGLSHSKDNKIFWFETNKINENQFKFLETGKDETYYYLRSVDRELELLIPVEGGQILLTYDNGKTLLGLYLVEKI